MDPQGDMRGMFLQRGGYKMQAMKIPKPQEPERLVFEKFRGVDFSNYSGVVDSTRSPDALNMMPNKNGQPIKRYGSASVKVDDLPVQYESQINGLYSLITESETYRLDHEGMNMWLRGESEPLCDCMNNGRSTGFQMYTALWIFDGQNYRTFRIDESPVFEEVAGKIPIAVIGRSPTDGGGTTYEAINLIQPERENHFYISAAESTAHSGHVTVFNLLAESIDAGTTPKVWTTTDGVTWTVRTDFTVNYSTAQITLATGVGQSPDEGVDSVKIRFSYTTEGNADKIKKCTIYALFGLSTYNQVFASGNSSYINYHWFCDPFDPTYWPDTNYAIIGQDNTAVMGYRKVGANMAIIKENNYQDATAFLMSGSIETVTDAYGDDVTQIVYTIQQGIAGVGAIAKNSFVDLRDDHMFLSEDGYFAIVTSAVTAERNAKPRSSMINRVLTKEPGIADAQAICHKGFLYLSINDKVFVADATQKHAQSKASEDAEYEWYYLTGLHARVWAIESGELVFGTADGKIIKVITNEEEATYLDDSEAIKAYWTTPSIDMGAGDFYKTIQYLYTRILPFSSTGVKIYIKIDGAWEQVDEKMVSLFAWRFGFAHWTFNTNTEDATVATVVKTSKIITTQFKFENNEPGQGFGLQNIVAQYIVKNRVF